MTLFQQYNQDAAHCEAGNAYDKHETDYEAMQTATAFDSDAGNLIIVFGDNSRIVYGHSDLIIPTGYTIDEVAKILGN